MRRIRATARRSEGGLRNAAEKCKSVAGADLHRHFRRGAASGLFGFGPESLGASATIAVISFVVASIVASAIKVADQWERVVVLRLGRFRCLEGPGLFFIVPVSIPSPTGSTSRHHRDVQGREDADPRHRAGRRRRRAVLEGDRSEKGGARRRRLVSAINWAAQTALRDVIGKTMLADMLEGREGSAATSSASSTRAPSPGASM